MRRVAIVGIGYTAFRSVTPDLHFHELSFEAAKKAYIDAGVDPRKDIDGFIMCGEDTDEGQQVIDVELPDPIGAMLTSSVFLGNEGMVGLITAYIQIYGGMADIIAVEARSKASNILTPKTVETFALDPILHRPLQADTNFIAGMEMNRFLYDSGNTKEQCALVSVKNKRNALDNPTAAYGDTITVGEVLASEMVSFPLSKLDISSKADGSICIVLASEERAKSLACNPIWIKGLGWCGDTSSLEYREWSNAVYTEIAATKAYQMAGIMCPRKEIHFVEVDDTFSYKELQHLEALNLCRKGESGHLLEEGVLSRGGDLPVNVSGGSLGQGHLLCATGLSKVLEIVIQLRGEAGKRQIKNAKTGLAQYWRGLPTAKGGVMILSN
jgi:acetyl-CoA C-acetyltransferase